MVPADIEMISRKIPLGFKIHDIDDGVGQGGEVVALEIEFPQIHQPADLRRKLDKLVVGEVEILKLGEVANGGGEVFEGGSSAPLTPPSRRFSFYAASSFRMIP